MLIFEMRDGFSIVVMEEEWCFLLWCEGVVMMEDEFSWCVVMMEDEFSWCVR